MTRYNFGRPVVRAALFLGMLAVCGRGTAQGTPDCATLSAPPDTAAGQRCLLISEPVIAIVYSEQDAQRMAGGRRQQVIDRLIGHLERWSGRTLGATQRTQLRSVFARRLQIQSTLSMSPDDSGNVFMLQGALAYEVTDMPLLAGLFGEAAEGVVFAVPAPAPTPQPAAPAPPPSAPRAPAPAPPAAERWNLALALVDVTGGTVRPQTLDFGPSGGVLGGASAQVASAGPDFSTRVEVRPGTGALQAVLRLDGYYPAPAEEGAFIVPRESLPVRWERPAAGDIARQEVRLVPQQPVIAELLNLAGLDEDQLDMSSDLLGLVAVEMARRGHTHFLQMNGYGRRVEIRSQSYFPANPDELTRSARELLDDSVVDAGPLLPQLGGGLVQCRSAGIAPCWVVYVVRRAFANRPSRELAERLRALPQAGERVLIVELLGRPGERPLYADASPHHLGITLPEGWPEGGAAALQPLARRIADELTAGR